MLFLASLLITGSITAIKLTNSPTPIPTNKSSLASPAVDNAPNIEPKESPSTDSNSSVNEFPQRANPGPSAPSVSAEAYLLIDLLNPSTLLERKARQPRQIASITKLATAVVSLRLGNKLDVLEVSGNASMQPPTKMGLLKGDRIRVGDLLAGLLLDSGNDAAKALEEGLGGNEYFVDSMNRLAQELAMNDTMFDNSAGFDSDSNFSTAYDLALLARHIILNEPEIMQIVSSNRLSIESNDGHGWFGPQNMNRLIAEYDGAIGLKTGETDKAGLSLLAAARRGDRIIVAVVLSSQNHFDDARRLLDHGFKTDKAVQ